MKTIEDNVLKDYCTDLKLMYKELQRLKITNNTDETPPYLQLDEIKIWKKFRNQGWGTEVLIKICRFADTHNVQVRLYASDILGSDLEGLYRFYRKHDFVSINNSENNFIYKPKKIIINCNKSKFISYNCIENVHYTTIFKKRNANRGVGVKECTAFR